MGCGGKSDNFAFGGIKSNKRGACSTPADGTIVDKEDITHARFAIGLDIGEAGVSVAINLNRDDVVLGSPEHTIEGGSFFSRTLGGSGGLSCRVVDGRSRSWSCIEQGRRRPRRFQEQCFVGSIVVGRRVLEIA